MNNDAQVNPAPEDGRIAGTMIFLCGAEMHPHVARQRYPRGRFIEIARASLPLPGLPSFPGGEVPAVWGILLRVPEQRANDGPRIAVTLTSSLQTTAVLGTTEADLADRAQVLAAVRYWELPAAYREAMAAIVRE